MVMVICSLGGSDKGEVGDEVRQGGQAGCTHELLTWISTPTYADPDVATERTERSVPSEPHLSVSWTFQLFLLHLLLHLLYWHLLYCNKLLVDSSSALPVSCSDSNARRLLDHLHPHSLPNKKRLPAYYLHLQFFLPAAAKLQPCLMPIFAQVKTRHTVYSLILRQRHVTLYKQ